MCTVSQREIELIDNADQAYTEYISGQSNVDTWLDIRNTAVNEMANNLSKEELDSWRIVLNSGSAVELWKKINWKGEIKGTKVNERGPPLDELANQFKSKSSKTENDVPVVNININNTTYVDALDKPIEVEEISESCKRLKDSKSTFDGWSPHMITKCSDVLFPIIQFVFNFILLKHVFPVQWILTLINAIFKNKGSQEKAKYYRPVSLVCLLNKLFDFILLSRFMKWFVPSDEQSAYQSGRSCADNIFLVRCLINLAKKSKSKLFLMTVDFDGAFDRISRSLLFRKLVLFGAGSTYVACLMAIYKQTDCIIFGKREHVCYQLEAGIKQGSPLSPMLFLFYVNDIFDYFTCTFAYVSIYEIIHILMHADDAILLASTKELAIAKLKHLATYCTRNSILIEPSKSNFIVINGTGDDKYNLTLASNSIDHSDHLALLGSHLSEKGSLKEDLKYHVIKRYLSCIKFYNFIRSNIYTPIPIKLKVLKSCVMSNILYNCETFGKEIPEALKTAYFKLLKAAVGVRSNTPNDILLIECGLLPLGAIVYGRQLNFFRRYKSTIIPGSSRSKLFAKLLDEPPPYLQHYTDLDAKYNNCNEIHFEHIRKVKDKIKRFAENDIHYKYKMYMQINPDLKPSPFVNDMRSVCKAITKFRLGSHLLPIETGRWCRKPRGERLCESCNVLGDELHLLYSCKEVDRTDLNLPNCIRDLWETEDTITLFKRIDSLSQFI